MKQEDDDYRQRNHVQLKIVDNDEVNLQAPDTLNALIDTHRYDK